MTTKDQEIADLKKRCTDAEARLKKIEEVMAEWDEKDKARKGGYPGSAYDLNRKRRRGWGGGGPLMKYGMPF